MDISKALRCGGMNRNRAELYRESTDERVNRALADSPTRPWYCFKCGTKRSERGEKIRGGWRCGACGCYEWRRAPGPITQATRIIRSTKP